MSDLQHSIPKPPPCPLCTGDMELKKIHKAQPVNHFIFKCGKCAVEYPIVPDKRLK